MQESGIEQGVVIADKGFYSEDNVKHLEDENLNYMIPLKRNSRLIDYNPLRSGNKQNLSGYFEYQKRFIWYYAYQKEGRKIITYLDEHLKSIEEKDYLSRIKTHPEEYCIENFFEKQHTFGTFSLISNLMELSPEVHYQYYKGRVKIEQMFDVFKNLLMADRTYPQDPADMQKENALEGWMFINTIALQWYYKIYQLLLSKKLLSKYSIKDFLLLHRILRNLSEIKKVKINDEWKLAEINTKTKTLLNKLEIEIPIT